MENKQLSFIDILSIASFVIGLMNLEENLTQGDKQELMEDFNNKVDFLLTEIHQHLENQDYKLDSIFSLLKESVENDYRGSVL